MIVPPMPFDVVTQALEVDVLVLHLVDDLVEILRREDFGGFRLGRLSAFRTGAPLGPLYQSVAAL